MKEAREEEREGETGLEEESFECEFEGIEIEGLEDFDIVYRKSTEQRKSSKSFCVKKKRK